MKRLLLAVCLALALAGCGGDGEWGGYTEGEAKDILATRELRESLIENAPGGPTGETARLIPTAQQVRESDLTKKTLEGQEAWEYRDANNNFCIYVWHDAETDDFTTQVSACVAD
jgi:hypothetical protein